MGNPGKPIRVMLIDDDAVFRNYLHQALEEWVRIEVHEARNGQEACKLFKECSTEFDLIVCDVFMPDMDGLEFLDYLCRQKYRGKLTMVSGGDPVILEIARTFAVQSGLQLAGAFPKEAVTSALLSAIVNFS